MNGKIKVGEEIGPGVRVALRQDEDGDRLVTIRKMRDGETVAPGREVAHVGDADGDGWQGVTTLYKSGPAQVATPAYREGYDRIFGTKGQVGQA